MLIISATATTPISNLAGATLGVIGGDMRGHAVANLSEAFGIKVLCAAYR